MAQWTSTALFPNLHALLETEVASSDGVQNRQEAEPAMPDLPGEAGGPVGPKESEEEGELEADNQENRASKGMQLISS